MRSTLRWVMISAALAAPARASAQAVLLEVGGGASVPLMETGRTLGIGPQGVVGLVLIPQSIPLGLELSARLGRISGSTTNGTAAPDLRVGDVSANVIYRMKWSLRAAVRPWVLGGAGLYELKATGDAAPADADPVRKPGLDGGAGIAVPLGNLELWTDARFHLVFTDDTHTHLFTASLGARIPLHRPARIR
jgi:Outer membrane protein beta-barrel domain